MQLTLCRFSELLLVYCLPHMHEKCIFGECGSLRCNSLGNIVCCFGSMVLRFFWERGLEEKNFIQVGHISRTPHNNLGVFFFFSRNLGVELVLPPSYISLLFFFSSTIFYFFLNFLPSYFFPHISTNSHFAATVYLILSLPYLAAPPPLIFLFRC